MLLELLNEILDFSRIETGRFQLEAVPFSLRHIVEQTLKTMGVRACEKGLELIADLPDDLPDRYLGDPLRLRQILLNLVGNAIKFTKQGEIVVSVVEKGRGERGEGREASEESLAAEPKKFSRDPKASESKACEMLLQFSVKDTGIGIAAEDQQQVFDPFTQADASTTRSYGGTGLGLAISSNLVKMMGGRIWVESQPGRGSTFYFTVELACQPDAPGDSEAALRATGKDCAACRF